MLKSSIRVTPALRRPSLGFSLIELLLVLGVLAILLVAAFVVYPQVRDDSLAERTTKTTMSVAAGVESLFHNSSYSGLNNAMAIDANLVPDHMVVEQGSPDLASEWGGSVSVSAAGANSRGWRIVYEDVPEQICNRLIGGLGGHFSIIAINDEVVKDHTIDMVDPGQVALACEETNVFSFGAGPINRRELLAGGPYGTDIPPPDTGGGGPIGL